jgi:hypothetical protein
MLIQRIYHVDPLVCPKCGGRMKIISFVEARQDEVIRKILEHCGLWHPGAPRPRAPPHVALSSRQVGATPGPDSGSSSTCEIDPDFREHLRRERQADQLQLPWEYCDQVAH